MSVSSISQFLVTASPGDLKEWIRGMLDVPSPRIGANGPPAPSPDEPIVHVLTDADEPTLERVGKAVNCLLLDEVNAICNEKDAHPFLIFNLLYLLESVVMPGVEVSLGALQGMNEQLKPLLIDSDCDLYEHVLLAIAANQRSSGKADLWGRMLDHDNVAYACIAIAGLREIGWEIVCKKLPHIKELYRRPPHKSSLTRRV